MFMELVTFQHQKQFYLFLPHWETGANISISILFDHIWREFNTMNYNRPPKLVLQVDNCVKEGKNKYVFAFAAHLIHFGWFNEVEIVSLIQGHTHDLIDREFSGWAEAEKKRCIETIYDIPYFMKHSFNSNSNKEYSYTLLRWMFDWSKFFTPTLAEVTGTKSARCFRFSKSSENKVVLHWKTNSLETVWKGFKIPESELSYGIQICKNYVDHFPTIIPASQLSKKDLEIIANKPSFISCYKADQAQFWKRMLIDSTYYLKDTNPLTNESK
jgi:hypothetical protein